MEIPAKCGHATTTTSTPPPINKKGKYISEVFNSPMCDSGPSRGTDKTGRWQPVKMYPSDPNGSEGMNERESIRDFRGN